MSPSERLNTAIQLPIPTAAASAPSAERLSRDREDETYVLSARLLIPIAFNLQPDIKSSYQRFKSEEARYDFFVVSRDSLTPTFRSSNQVGETRENPDVLRQREHRVEVGIEKLFFDTTELNVGVGYQANLDDEEDGSFPFVSADLRYPLWASREKLGRTSEEIFRRNELNDAQLDYIKEVRERLQSAMFRYYTVTDLDRRIGYASRYLEHLESLKAQITNIDDRDVTSDERRVQAEIAKINAELRNVTGRHQVDLARLKAACGIPLYANVEIVVEPFNPFAGNTHEESFRLSIETDPEILTLRNEIRNAEVQLDLARRGQWDIALLMAGQSSIEGSKASDGDSDWALSLGFEVSHVDPRVTDSLTRQAQARIRRFTEAIAARENDIFVDTLEPLIRIDTLSQSRDELRENLPRFEEDYSTGLKEHFAGKLNIDDLLKRRETVWQQELEISRLTLVVGFNVAELCTATGKFFELLEDDKLR
ncbi:MAG: TolC family protein [Phycisphaerae bacterium]